MEVTKKYTLYVSAKPQTSSPNEVLKFECHMTDEQLNEWRTDRSPDFYVGWKEHK